MKNLSEKDKEELAKRYVSILPTIATHKRSSKNLFIFFSILVAGIGIALSFANLIYMAIVVCLLETFPLLICLINKSSVDDNIAGILRSQMSVREFKSLLRSGKLDELINKEIVLKNEEIKIHNEHLTNEYKSFNNTKYNKLILEDEIKPKKTKKSLIKKLISKLDENRISPD